MVASVGDFGRSDANSERDLHRWVANMFDSLLEKYHLKMEANYVNVSVTTVLPV